MVAPPKARSAATDGWISLALVAAAALIYGRTVGHGFVTYDDLGYFVQNPHVATGLTGANVVWAFTHAYAANWHPLTWISHMIDCQVFGTSDRAAGFHHLVSAALHAFNAVLLFQLFRAMTGARWTSAWVALMFVAHPLRVESVAWASERKDVLSGCFFLLTLWAYRLYAERPRVSRMAGVAAAHAAGLMAKPMLVTVPLVLLALDVWPLGRWRPRSDATPRAVPFSRLVIEKTPLFALSLASSLVTVFTQKSWGAVASLGAISWSWRLLNTPVSYVVYVVKSVWPTGLSCFVPHPATLHPIAAWVPLALGSTALLLAVTVLALRSLRLSPYLASGWAWYLIMLAPVIGVFQVGDQAWASRYAYLPLIGIYSMVGFAIRDRIDRSASARRLVAAAAVASAVILAGLAFRQAGTWRDSQTLFEHAIEIAPDNWFAHNALGAYELDQGRLDEARQHLEASVRILPSYADAFDNLCILRVREGRPQDAIEAGRRALALRPRFPEAHANLAIAWLATGHSGEARGELEEALREKPELLTAQLALATLLASDRDPAVRDPERGLALALDAVRRTGSRDAQSLAVLATAYAGAGRIDEAIQSQSRAAERAPVEQREAYLAVLQRYQALRGSTP